MYVWFLFGGGGWGFLEGQRLDRRLQRKHFMGKKEADVIFFSIPRSYENWSEQCEIKSHDLQSWTSIWVAAIALLHLPGSAQGPLQLQLAHYNMHMPQVPKHNPGEGRGQGMFAFKPWKSSLKSCALGQDSINIYT